MNKSKNSTAREDNEEVSFQYLSPAGMQFHAEKEEIKIMSLNKSEASVEEEEETERHLLDSSNVSVHSYDMAPNVASTEEFPGMFVQEIPKSDPSNDEKDCDDRAADSLDQVFDVAAQKMEVEEKESTLTEEDGAASEEVENETQNHHLHLVTDAASTAADLSQLDKIQRMPAYTLHRDLVIGKGSYGEVYIASRGKGEGHFSSKPGKRKKFACKCVSLPADPKYICKLQEEVNVLRVLRGHVNVIRLFDVFVLDNELLIITELGTGGDLFHLLATHPKHGVSEEYAGKIHLDIFCC